MINASAPFPHPACYYPFEVSFRNCFSHFNVTLSSLNFAASFTKLILCIDKIEFIFFKHFFAFRWGSLILFFFFFLFMVTVADDFHLQALSLFVWPALFTNKSKKKVVRVSVTLCLINAVNRLNYCFVIKRA